MQDRKPTSRLGDPEKLFAPPDVHGAPRPPPVGRSHLRDASAARERSLRLAVLPMGAAGRVCPPTFRRTDPLSGNFTIGNAKR